ncbi:MAG: ADP-ribosylglycohydrolase family protein [Caldilineaceae bacterium]|nr:ADP-ribosylglycohydrolase family protein [Caldilineaceae bacterium]MBP9074792.1 ADP-ribosylglycohydrolase family protein [Caldilineaceae bacterium]
MPSSLPENYRERVYAGWLGKCIGVRLGAPMETWTYDEIQRNLGEVTDFLPLPPGKLFKPDDDTAVPMILIRAVEDYGPHVTPAQIGETLLNYVADQRGSFWWGGYGVSTEHTAYLNLLNGIPAPRSGSIAQNGPTVAEQIGGQIFSDIWGLIAPANMDLAADFAQRASSVSHDGEAIFGGRYIAALTSQAFVTSDATKLVRAGLTVIPGKSEYARVVNAVLGFHQRQPGDWRACYHFIADNFGYDRYAGEVPIIPNAGVVVMGLLYGGGDFSRALCITTMAGWDTDCNVGNVGAIMGVAVGLEGIDMARWRQPMNDVLVAASVIGSRNLTDIPACADLFCDLGEMIARTRPGARPPRYHFGYPGSTHGFLSRTRGGSIIDLRQTTAEGRSGLQATVRKLGKKGEAQIYVKTYARPAELSANYYGASFSPTIYPGQTLTATVFVPEDAPGSLLAAPYVWDDNGQAIHQAMGQPLTPGQWHDLAYAIPALDNALLSEAGILIHNVDQPWSGSLLLGSLDWRGPAQFSTDFSRERREYDAISQWTFLRGYWRLQDGGYHGSSATDGETYTGDVTWGDLSLTVDLAPLVGEHHNINVRVQGARHAYAVGLAPDNQVKLYKKTGAYREIAGATFAWRHGQRYRFQVLLNGPEISVVVDGRPLILWTDTDAPYLHGQIGLSTFGGSHTRYERVAVSGRRED